MGEMTTGWINKSDKSKVCIKIVECWQMHPIIVTITECILVPGQYVCVIYTYHGRCRRFYGISRMCYVLRYTSHGVSKVYGTYRSRYNRGTLNNMFHREYISIRWQLQSSRHKCYDPPGKINIMNRKIAFSPEEDVHV